MADGPETTAGRQPSSVAWRLFPVGVALAVTAAVYLATQVITPDINTSLFGQSAAGVLSLKSWLANGRFSKRSKSSLWAFG
jgi:hypothetical protein